MARDLSNADGASIASARGDEPYASVEEIQRRAGVGRGALSRIGDADGFGSIGASRRSGLWEAKGLGDASLPLFAAADVGDRVDVADVYRVSRADVVKHGMGPDPAERPLGKRARDIYIPDLRLGSGIQPGEPLEGIKFKARDFR